MCLHFPPLYKSEATISRTQLLPSCAVDISLNQYLQYVVAVQQWTHGIESYIAAHHQGCDWDVSASLLESSPVVLLTQSWLMVTQSYRVASKESIKKSDEMYVNWVINCQQIPKNVFFECADLIIKWAASQSTSFYYSLTAPDFVVYSDHILFLPQWP